MPTQFFLALEKRGHRVVSTPNSEQFHRAKGDESENPGKRHHHTDLWSPMRCTVTHIGTAAIGLAVIEMSGEAEARYVNGEYICLTDYDVSTGMAGLARAISRLGASAFTAGARHPQEAAKGVGPFAVADVRPPQSNFLTLVSSRPR